MGCLHVQIIFDFDWTKNIAQIIRLFLKIQKRTNSEYKRSFFSNQGNINFPVFYLYDLDNQIF